MAGPPPLVLVVTQAAHTVPVRIELTKMLTTLGSSPEADVSLPLLPAQFAVAMRRGDAVVVRVLADGREHTLAPGDAVALGAVQLALVAQPGEGDVAARVAELAGALTGAESPDEAVRLIVTSVMRTTGADSGAALVRERASYRVVAAIDASGAPLPNAHQLLSDTVVRDALGTGGSVCVGDVRAHQRYAAVPSVVALRLQSILCVPMRSGQQVLGALYFGKRDLRAGFTEQQSREIQVLAAMAVPLVAQLRRGAAAPASAEAMLVGESPAMRELHRLVERVAPTDLCVLLSGETGTGKEVTAAALHRASGRGERPMIAINCAGVPPTLLEAELFGYGKGAFTGADADRPGKIEAADGSTLLLDEIGDMPLAMQAALLRVLQERAVCRLGETRPRPVDVRLLAATHRDLDVEVAAGRFRQDLLYRLREITVVLPPLRERGDDILLLARLFLHRTERELSLPAHTLARSAEVAMLAHPWPGNVRELRAVMRRAAVLADGTELTAADLGLPPPASAEADGAGGVAATAARPGAIAAPGAPLGDLSRPLVLARDQFVARYVAAVLELHGGDRQAAADALGISVRSLYRYL